MLKILAVLLIVMFPVGLLIMLTDFGRYFIWTTSIFLALQGLILFLVLIKTSGVTKALILTLLITILSFIIEYIGLATGFPFGEYNYTEALPPIVSGMPVAITFAWFSVTVSSYFTTVVLFGKAGAFAASFISSVLILASDILLEPFAAFINVFWIWGGGKIPIQNFVSWLVLGFLFSFIMSLFIKPGSIRLINGWTRKIPIIVYAVNIMTFFIVNIFNGYIVISVVAMIVIVLLTLIFPGGVKYET